MSQKEPPIHIPEPPQLTLREVSIVTKFGEDNITAYNSLLSNSKKGKLSPPFSQDTLAVILELLDAKDLGSLAQTDRYFYYRIILTPSILWNKLSSNFQRNWNPKMGGKNIL
jgi:hypothetical protein